MAAPRGEIPSDAALWEMEKRNELALGAPDWIRAKGIQSLSCVWYPDELWGSIEKSDHSPDYSTRVLPSYLKNDRDAVAFHQRNNIFQRNFSTIFTVMTQPPFC